MYIIMNTIDEKHTEMCNMFTDIENVMIPSLLNEKKRLKAAIRELKENQLDTYLDLKDKIANIDTELRELRIKKKKYLLENSKFIFNYFEHKQQISNTVANNTNTNVLNSFFKIKSATPDADTLCSDKNTQSKKAYMKYWRNVNNEICNINDFVIPTDICQLCSKGELIPQDEEGILICNNNNCGKFVIYIVDNSKPTNKEPPNEVSYTAYIRLNHFKEILSQFQAKETTQIPAEVIENIKLRLKKERITDYSTLNYAQMREILRKLGYNKYFEHIQYINSQFGIKPPIMSEELYETLCVLFIEIQKPWSMFCPIDRTNFFNYTYILYQLCVLLGQTQYIKYITLLKDQIKQREQDATWKLVCGYLDWEYYPTI